jgi:hypothetical protein
MYRWTVFALILAACASAPRAASVQDQVFEGYAVAAVRDAARAVVEDLAHPMSVVRVTEEGSVITEGWIGDCPREVTCAGILGYQGNPGSRVTPWATIEVGLRDFGTDTAVEVEIVYEDCEPGVGCQPQRLASTGALERRILDHIRARLESPESPGLALP